MSQGDLSDGEWGTDRAFPSERGRRAQPAGYKPAFSQGMLHVLWISSPKRDVNELYGKWCSVYVRCANQGVTIGFILAGGEPSDIRQPTT